MTISPKRVIENFFLLEAVNQKIREANKCIGIFRIFHRGLHAFHQFVGIELKIKVVSGGEHNFSVAESDNGTLVFQYVIKRLKPARHFGTFVYKAVKIADYYFPCQ